MPGSVDTRQVTDRRVLKFAGPADALGDAKLIAAAELAGTLRSTGNWTPGQVFGHLAAWMGYSFDGYPLVVPPEMAAKARAVLHTRVLDGYLLAGFKIPGVAGGTVGTEPLPTEEGLRRLELAWARLRAGCPTREHPFFGPMSHVEWIKLQLRHSELHQSYLHPGEAHSTPDSGRNS